MMDFLCMQWMHCQSLPFNAIKRLISVLHVQHVCRILLNFWVLFNRGFCSTASLFKFCFFSECTQKKTTKQLFFYLRELFVLKTLQNFTTLKAQTQNQHAFQIMQICITFRVFSLISLRVKLFFAKVCVSKWMRIISIKNLNFISRHWLTRYCNL